MYIYHHHLVTRGYIKMEQCSNGNVFICTQSLIQELIKVTINDNVKQVCFANDSSEDGQLKGMKKR